MAEGVIPQSATVSFRRPDCEVQEGLAFARVSMDRLREVVPWRTFRWHAGQTHYSGFYWSSTMRDHVIYESRLELSRLLLADFDPAVSFIAAQPFLLSAQVAGVARKHVPDFLLETDRGPVVVDVKPERKLADAAVRAALGWARQAVEQRGWEYEVASEVPSVRLENIRFLAGYRRPWLFDPGALAVVFGRVVDGMTVCEAVAAVPELSAHAARAAVLHLLWLGRLHADLDEPLGSSPLMVAAQ